ncbi:hypothetical protein [Flavobacterium tructae]|uniref:hypothetical protein n=1 Tax=Flavobacterium tructae TaxID=1114873 RepID=UPI0035A8548B
MSNITITKLYFLLSEKVGKETAENLTTYIESKIDKEVEYSTRHLASREDLVNMQRKMIKRLIYLFCVIALLLIGLYFK